MISLVVTSCSALIRRRFIFALDMTSSAEGKMPFFNKKPTVPTWHNHRTVLSISASQVT